MVVRCVCFNDEIPKDPSTKEARRTKPETMATDCAFGFRVSDFLRIWVFRHSGFRAHHVYGSNSAQGREGPPEVRCAQVSIESSTGSQQRMDGAPEWIPIRLCGHVAPSSPGPCDPASEPLRGVPILIFLKVLGLLEDFLIDLVAIDRRVPDMTVVQTTLEAPPPHRGVLHSVHWESIVPVARFPSGFPVADIRFQNRMGSGY
jgi:hypothetical protein